MELQLGWTRYWEVIRRRVAEGVITGTELWGRTGELLGDKEPPGEVGTSRCRATECDPPIQNACNWGLGSLKWLVWRPVKGSGTSRKWVKEKVLSSRSQGICTCIILMKSSPQSSEVCAIPISQLWFWSSTELRNLPHVRVERTEKI